MKIGNRVAHFLCDRTVEKWLNFRLSNTWIFAEPFRLNMGYLHNIYTRFVLYV